MKTLNERYDYGMELILLSVDEGITGYRDDSLEVTSSYRLLIAICCVADQKVTISLLNSKSI